MNYPQDIASLLGEAVETSDPMYTGLQKLSETKRRLDDGDPTVREALEALVERARSALLVEPITIVTKPQTPPSGDRHDYMSMGPYWWPDPDRADGLPYIRRDGERNPEVAQYDRPKLAQLVDAVSRLALAFALTGDDRFASHAAALLRTWFVEAETRMNPNLQFGQAIPGRCDGRGIGLIETAALARSLLPAVGMIEGALAWTGEDCESLRGWFYEFMRWMLEHPYGMDEARTKNNHATAYDLQVATYALFLGRTDVARAVLEDVGDRRIATQVEPDGTQPFELARTKALGYSSGNLGLFLHLAAAGRLVGVDLTAYRTDDGRSIRMALDWLVPYWTGKKPWAHDQIAPFPPERALEDLRLAAWLYEDPSYEYAIEQFDARYTVVTEPFNLLYPPYIG